MPEKEIGLSQESNDSLALTQTIASWSVTVSMTRRAVNGNKFVGVLVLMNYCRLKQLLFDCKEDNSYVTSFFLLYDASSKVGGAHPTLLLATSAKNCNPAC